MANWRGAWASGTAYIAGDSVSYGGTSYYCVTACTGQVPSSSGDWALQDSFEGPAAGGASGAASGDLSGTYPAPVVAKIQGTAITAPPGGTTAFLRGDGTWVAPAGGGGGITPPAGDIGGSAGTPTVTATHLSSPLPVAQGGTNAATVGAALTSLGAASATALTTETSRAEVAEALLAPLASPALTGTPTAPTKTALTNTTALATTAYADAAVATEVTARTTAIGVETSRATAAEALCLSLVPTGVKTSAYTAVAADYVPVDTTSGNVTVTLPVTPPNLTMVGVKQVIQGGTNTVTVSCGAGAVLNKAGGGTTLTLTLASQGALLQYASGPGIWYVLADDLGLSTLDARYATPASVTTAVGTETTRAEAAETLLAPLASPALTGSPTAPTQTTGDTTTKIATDAFVGAQIASTVKAPDVQWYTAVGTATWTKPAGAVTTEAFVMSGGSGAGSGRRGAASTVRCGGGGGGGATLVSRQFVTSDLASTVTVTVGDGGAGGGAVTADDTSGSNGSPGGTSSFGAYLVGPSYGGGTGGTATLGSGAVGVLGGAGTCGAGGSASTTGAAGVGVQAGVLGAPGGPSGGGITSGNVAGNGAVGNYSYLSSGSSSTYGAAGVVDTTTPTTGTSTGIKGAPGGSPGSGAASITTAAQSGASAYANSGSGGSGGGASLDGNNSGAGSKGGSGFALVISYFQ